MTGVDSADIAILSTGRRFFRAAKFGGNVVRRRKRLVHIHPNHQASSFLADSDFLAFAHAKPSQDVDHSES